MGSIEDVGGQKVIVLRVCGGGGRGGQGRGGAGGRGRGRSENPFIMMMIIVCVRLSGEVLKTVVPEYRMCSLTIECVLLHEFLR